MSMDSERICTINNVYFMESNFIFLRQEYYEWVRK